MNGTLKRVHSSVHRLGVDGQSQPILPTTSTTAGNRRNMRRAVRTAEGKRTYVLVAQQVEATAQGSLKCRSDSCPRHEAMSFSAWCQRGCRNISLISLSLSSPPIVPVSQLVEEAVSEAVRCWFKSSPEHETGRARHAFSKAIPPIRFNRRHPSDKDRIIHPWSGFGGCGTCLGDVNGRMPVSNRSYGSESHLRHDVRVCAFLGHLSPDSPRMASSSPTHGKAMRGVSPW